MAVSRFLAHRVHRFNGAARDARSTTGAGVARAPVPRSHRTGRAAYPRLAAARRAGFNRRRPCEESCGAAAPASTRERSWVGGGGARAPTHQVPHERRLYPRTEAGKTGAPPSAAKHQRTKPATPIRGTGTVCRSQREQMQKVAPPSILRHARASRAYIGKVCSDLSFLKETAPRRKSRTHPDAIHSLLRRDTHRARDRGLIAGCRAAGILRRCP